MKTRSMILTTLVAGIFITGLAIGGSAIADEDEKSERGQRREHNERYEKNERHERGGRYKPAVNETYGRECASCHFLYLPGFLPARSWEKIVKGSDKHFGENLALDDRTKEELISFLTAHSAEKTNTEWAQKIMKSVGAGTPERITDIQWIVKEHRKISTDVYKRKSIGSRSNCGACHTKGAEGNFEEDAITIPEQ